MEVSWLHVYIHVWIQRTSEYQSRLGQCESVLMSHLLGVSAWASQQVKKNLQAY